MFNVFIPNRNYFKLTLSKALEMNYKKKKNQVKRVDSLIASEPE